MKSVKKCKVQGWICYKLDFWTKLVKIDKPQGRKQKFTHNKKNIHGVFRKKLIIVIKINN